MKSNLLRSLSIFTALLLLVTTAQAQDLSAVFKEVQAAPKSAKFAEQATRLLALAKAAPTDSAAAEALVWVVSNDPDGSELVEQALALLAKDHGASAKLGGTFRALAELAPSVNVEKFLRAIVANNPEAELKSSATFYLAQTLKRQFDVLTMKLQNAQAAVDVEALEIQNGKALIAKLRATKPAVLSAEAEKLYQQVLAGGGDAKAGRRSLSGAAKSELFELQNLSVGRTAPETEGEDVDGKRFKLSDQRGKVVVIVFWGDW